ncbi:MAG: 50S ribosomal protein L10 [Planctomyces sp.]|nr:50S ribosomal protein L10 [Planctomyces sp.]
MSKAVKGMMIAEIRQHLGETRDLLVLNTSKLDGVRDNTMRLALQKKGIRFLQVKNSLARRALAETSSVSLDHCLDGPSTLVWGGEDVVGLSKEIAQWVKKFNKLEVKGGTVDGQAIDAAGFDSLSKSPGRLELLSQISGLILSPGARLSAALLGPGGKVSGQVKTLADKEEEAAPAA